MKIGALAKKIMVIVAALGLLAGCARVPLAGQAGGGNKEYIWGAKRIGQTFRSSDRNLTRIDVYLYPSRALAGKKTSASRTRVLESLGDKRVVLKLFSFPQKKALAEVERPIDNVKAGLDRFSFEPLPGSKKQRYYFEIQAPELTTETAIAVAFTSKDQYENGRAYFGGRPVSGQDLRFKPVISMNARMLASSVAPRLAADPFFMVFWGLLVALTAGALVAVGRRDDDPTGISGQ